MKKLLVLSAVLAVAACSKPADQMPGEGTAADSTAAAPAAAEDPVKTALMQCVVCHKIGAGEASTLGPNLHGVVGRKAGTLAGFAYSDAMKNSGKTWDETTLNAYLEKPMTYMPGNRMAYAGEPNAEKRQAMIDALKTLK